MANIKWSGIESFKYGLTARWYVSAFYGNDVDVDGVGYYNPSTNTTGHGGPTRPFATMSKINQDANVLSGHVVVTDSGITTSTTITKPITIVGDGLCLFMNCSIGNTLSTNNNFYNLILLNCTIGSIQTVVQAYDINMIYGSYNSRTGIQNNYRSCFNEVTFTGNNSTTISNCFFNNCSGQIGNTTGATIIENIEIINCQNLTINNVTPRPAGNYKDYSVIIGTVKSSRSINGKTTGVTIEDFKIDGNYFVKSNSEVNLFGNASGSGASVAQLQTIFNNYFSPIYLDTWQDVDLSLKPTASDIVKFGGLSGTYIGALPVGYRFSAASLYNTYIDAVNSSNLAWDAVNSAIVIADGFDTAVYRSIRISLPQPIIVDPINFFANLVYNSEGTARQGVANQRIDTTVDLQPENTLNQRVVYDYKLAYSPNNVDALSAFKNFELNNVPYVDNEGESMLDDNYDSSERQRITVQDFMIEFTLRKIVIE